VTEAFLDEGASVLGVARRENLLRDLERDLRGRSGHFQAIIGDAREEATADHAVETARAEFGRLDILVNNVGVAIFRPIWSLAVQDYDDMMSSNMRSTFVFTRAAVPVFLEQQRGTIITIASMAGVHGYADLTVYCASKHAQVGFNRALDQELRPHNVKVSCILPGGTSTEIAMGEGRTPELIAEANFLEPQSVARAVLFAATQDIRSRILEIRLRPMSEEL